MNRKRREQPRGRRKASRKPLRRILVVCEGRVTEPEYLQGLKIYLRNPLLDVKVVSAAGVPRTLVDTAVEMKKESDRRRKRHPEDAYDEVWAMFDRDEHPNFEEACQKAESNDVRRALSNPCVELWLLLHFQDQTAPLDRHQARKFLKGHDPNYDKHVKFNRYAPGLEVACFRADELEQRAAKFTTDGNPTTEVYKLVKSLKI